VSTCGVVVGCAVVVVCAVVVGSSVVVVDVATGVVVVSAVVVVVSTRKQFNVGRYALRSSVRLSSSLSVTRWFCIKMAKRWMKETTQRSNPETSVFLAKNIGNSHRVISNGGIKNSCGSLAG